MSKIKKEKDKNKKTQQLETSGERERSKARSEARYVKFFIVWNRKSSKGTYKAKL